MPRSGRPSAPRVTGLRRIPSRWRRSPWFCAPRPNGPNRRFGDQARLQGEDASGRHPFFAAVFSECLTRNRRNYRGRRDGEVAEWRRQRFAKSLHGNFRNRILEAKDFERWEHGNAKDAAALMEPTAEDVLQMWPVSRRVNSSRADGDDATLISEACK